MIAIYSLVLMFMYAAGVLSFSFALLSFLFTPAAWISIGLYIITFSLLSHHIVNHSKIVNGARETIILGLLGFHTYSIILFSLLYQSFSNSPVDGYFDHLFTSILHWTGNIAAFDKEDNNFKVIAAVQILSGYVGLGILVSLFFLFINNSIRLSEERYSNQEMKIEWGEDGIIRQLETNGDRKKARYKYNLTPCGNCGSHDCEMVISADLFRQWYPISLYFVQCRNCGTTGLPARSGPAAALNWHETGGMAPKRNWTRVDKGEPEEG